MPKFEKGYSGGPGRPKKELCIPEILREIGRQEISPEDKRTKLQVWLEKVYLMAIEGDNWAGNFIADRTEGKPVAVIDQTVHAVAVPTIELVSSDDDKAES